AKIPPWGTSNWQLKTIESAPATAEPSISEGMTRMGSLAANGIAPSVMNDSPSTTAGAAASRSSRSKRSLNKNAASASPRGGVMPAAITAAIGVYTWLPSSPPYQADADLLTGQTHS